MSRCTGHCCRRFPLPASPEKLRENPGYWRDGEQIAAMVIPLGQDGTYEDGRPKFYYTCKNLAENGDCKVYEQRPSMCSEYPYGGPCDHIDKGCTMTPEPRKSLALAKSYEKAAE